MNAQHATSAQKPTPLKVVPPNPKAKTPSSTVPPEPQPTQKSSQTFQFPWKRCVIAGGILATLGFASLVKVPNDVNAEGQLRPKPKASRPVYMEVPGTVTQFLVEPGEVVKKGDKIAEVVTPDLDKEIIAKQTQLNLRRYARYSVWRVKPSYQKKNKLSRK